MKLGSHKVELMCYSAEKPQELGQGRAWAVIPGAVWCLTAAGASLDYRSCQVSVTDKALSCT